MTRVLAGVKRYIGALALAFTLLALSAAVGTSVGTLLRIAPCAWRLGALSPLILRVGAGSIRPRAVSLTA